MCLSCVRSLTHEPRTPVFQESSLDMQTRKTFPAWFGAQTMSVDRLLWGSRVSGTRGCLEDVEQESISSLD